MLDYAIQFGNYSLALWLSTHHPLPTKTVATYHHFRQQYKLRWFDY